MNSHKALTSNIWKFFKPNKRTVFFVLLAIFVLGFFTIFWINPSHAQSTPPQQPPKPLTLDQIKQIPGWDNWPSGKPTPPGTKLSDPETSGADLVPGSGIQHLVPSDQFTITSNVVAPASSAVGKIGGAIGDALAGIVLAVVIGVLAIIAAFCKEFVGFGAQALDLTLNPSLYNFTNNDMIRQGWVVVRDICNLFFLLVLLFIAICTILKIDKYHAKKTLLTLIIMALLINFSKPIAVFIFDGSQLLMNFFLSQMGQAGTGQGASTVIASATKIANIVYDTLPRYSNSSHTSLEIAVQYLFAVVFLFMLGVAYFVTALMLIIRIVVIMLLIIVSPFAFFAAIVPDFSKMSSQWWSALFEYSYYGPAAAFFLLLATKLENAIPNLTTTVGGAGNFTAIINNILHYLTVLVFLYASIFMAKKFGGAAGAAVVGNANKFMKWGAGWTKTGGMWGGIARGTGVADVYKGVRGGIAQRKGMRFFTKEGREIASKEREERWKGKVAPFSMAAARKQADDRKNDDQNKVDAGVARGSAADLLIASKRGTLSDEQIASAAVIKTISQSKELRKEVLGNLKDKGNTHLAALLRYKTRGLEDAPKANETDWRNASLSDFGEKEINDNKKLGDMNWEKVMDAQLKDDNNQQVNFKDFLVKRMGTIADADPRKFQNIVSGLDGARLRKVINDTDFKPIIERAKQAAGGQRNRDRGSQTGGYQSGGYGP